MDMSWQALLQEAAATSFEKTADTLAAAENDNCACIDLHQQQIHELSKKILLLPHQGRVLLLSRYCFRLSPEETSLKQSDSRSRRKKGAKTQPQGLREKTIWKRVST